MKILSILNPSSWLGQILVLGFFIVTGIVIGLKMSPPCPPTTVMSTSIRAKKGAIVDSNSSMTDQDCVTWLQGLSKKEIREYQK